MAFLYDGTEHKDFKNQINFGDRSCSEFNE